MTSRAQLVEWALSLASRGFPVFPCKADKGPAISSKAGGRGFLDASKDAVDVQRMFNSRGAALIGMPTGTASGWDALDIDPRHGGGEWATANEAMLPETLTHQTQSGGRHLLFLHAPGVRNSAGKIAQGIDVRGDGGYIVIPPSDGYSVISDADPVHWPDWLLDLVLKQSDPPPRLASVSGEPPSSKRIEALIQSCLDRVARSLDGQKHHTLRNQALYLGGISHHAGLSLAELQRRLVDALPTGVRDIEGARTTAMWGLERGASRPLDLPPDRPGWTPHQPQTTPDNVVPLDDRRAIADAGKAQDALYRSLARTEKGVAHNTVSNLLTILRHDPVLAGIVNYNELTHAAAILRPAPPPDISAPSLSGPYPRLWSEADESLILAYIQRTWTHQAKDSTLRSAMGAEAAMRSFHPILDWLATLQWDGKPRIERWMIEAFGCPDTPYIRDISVKFLCAAVRRVRRPGCKFDYMMVLEGEQGIGKSTAMKVLFSPDWFSDSLMHDLANKDAAIGLLGVWCVEMAEIDQLMRTEVETIKAFLSRTTDKYRPPFGRGDVVRERQGVIIGSTNQEDYLRDTTGNRRFWPARCRFAKPDWVAAHREQLWAEACAAEALDELLWLDSAETQAEAAIQQDDRMIEDAWQDRIEGYLLGRADVTSSEVMTECLEMSIKDQDKRQQMRVASIMRQMGWQRVVTRNGKSIRRHWVKSDAIVE